nr:hypothetical protein [Alistipes ihumii]
MRVEIERFGQRLVAVAVGILVRAVVRSLPADKLVRQRIDFLLFPIFQLFVGQSRTEVVANEHTEQVDLAQSSPGIMTAQGAGCGSVLHGGLLAVLFACHAFLKDVYPLVEQGISRVVPLYESPSDRGGSQVQS